MSGKLATRFFIDAFSVFLLRFHIFKRNSHLHNSLTEKHLALFKNICVTLSLRPSAKMLQDTEGRLRGVMSFEEMSPNGYLGPCQESIVSMTQNCVLVSNILGPTCVFLSKSMAECRLAVRKSGHTQTFHCLACIFFFLL